MLDSFEVKRKGVVMGRREWEKGEMRFGVKEFSTFRKALIEGMNAHQAALLKLAQEIHDDLMKTAKEEAGTPLGMLRINRRLEQRARARPTRSSGWGHLGGSDALDDNSDHDHWLIARALQKPIQGDPHQLRRPSASDPAFQAQPLPEVGSAERKLVRAQNQTKRALLNMAKQIHGHIKANSESVPLAVKFQQASQAFGFGPEDASALTSIKSALLERRQPRLQYPSAKNFPPYKASATSFEYGECFLSLNLEQRQAHWEVSENKSAVTRAWQTPLGKLLDRLLTNTQWSRGAGAKFWGGDEYHEEANQGRDGGDASYTTRVYPRPKLKSSYRF